MNLVETYPSGTRLLTQERELTRITGTSLPKSVCLSTICRHREDAVKQDLLDAIAHRLTL